ncbi:NUDIX domain-containing protein [Candidatus Woesearchaeota archaeon]|nr:NUDIX domain-containing protein [Candidatus Woesearchaeota archaeon]
MEVKDKKLHYIAITGKIFRHDGRVLIVKRSPNEKNYPNRWILPGGKLTADDYINLKPNSDGLWYNVIEKALRREIKEETNIDIDNIEYLIDMAFIRSDGIPTLIIACTCRLISGEIRLCRELIDYVWVNLEEAKDFDLIEGVYEELELAFSRLKHDPDKNR